MDGRDADDWDKLVRAGHTFLQDVARRRRTTSYTELNAVLQRRTGLMGFDFNMTEGRAAMGHLLGRIVERDSEDHRFMISALVIYLNANDAGSGFYALAKQRGLLDNSASKDAKEKFWIQQLNDIYSHFATSSR